MTIDDPRGTSLWLSIGIATIAAGAFLWMASINLEAQGAYYDELNKAVPSFAFVGRPSPMFSRLHVGSLPTMVMSYKSAAKAWLYGPWMALTGEPFTIRSWRLLSLGLVAVGLLAFVILARRAMPWWAMALFAALLITDANVVVASRHDWGPVAFGLFARLVLLGIWLRGQAAPMGPRPANTLALAFIIGFSVFEKLNAVVLLVPFALMIFLDARRRRPRHLMAALGGGVLGGLPLIIVNVTTWLSNGRLLSLGAIEGAAHQSQSELERVFAGTLGIGSGESIRIHALGHGPETWQIAGETTLIASAAALALLVGIRFSSALRSGEVRICVLAYVALPVAFVLLPRLTHSHHWTLATPFQYLAIALALTTLWNVRSAREVHRREAEIIQRGALVACLTVLIALRSLCLYDVVADFDAGRHGWRWHPDQTAFAQEASSLSEDELVIVADWGLATQIFCFSQGRQNHVREIYRSYSGPRQLQTIAQALDKRVVHIVAPRQRSNVTPAARTTGLIRDAHQLEGWVTRNRFGKRYPSLEIVTLERATPR